MSATSSKLHDDTVTPPSSEAEKVDEIAQACLPNVSHGEPLEKPQVICTVGSNETFDIQIREKRGWLVVFACFLLYFNMLGVIYAFGIFEAHYALYEFPGKAAKIALISSTSGGISLVLSMLAGRWVELYGVRIITIIGSIIFSGSLAAAGFCKSLPMLILTQGVFTGVGFGILNIPGTTATIPWFPHKQSLVLGIASSGAGLGGIFWSFITRIIISKLSYHWALWIMASVSAGLNAIAVILIQDPPALTSNSSSEGNTKENVSRTRRRPKLQSYREELKILKDPKFVTFYIGNAIVLFSYFVPFFYMPTFAQTRLRASAFEGAILAAVLNIGSSVGRILLGYLANTHFGTMNTIIVGMIISALCQLFLWLPSIYANSMVFLYICAFIYGFFGGGSVGIIPVVLAKIFPPERLPSITGLYLSSNLPGVMAGSPIAGAIFNSRPHGNWVPVILYSSLTMLLGVLIISITRFQVEKKLFATV